MVEGIYTKCPDCGSKIELGPLLLTELVGREIKCPCGFVLKVEEFDTTPDHSSAVPQSGQE